MIQKFIVTEGKTDSLLLEKILPEFEDIKIMTGSGYSSALSLASSILIYHKKPVLLLLDADSNNQTDITERYNFIRNYLRMAAPDALFRIILFQPEVETVFFQDAAVAEHLIGRPLTEHELKSAHSSPKKVLQEAISGNYFELISELNNDDISRLNQLAIFKEIKSFIQQENRNILECANEDLSYPANVF